MRIIEAWCPKCRDIFNPHSEEPEDLEHFECGTTGELRGVWVAPDVVNPWAFVPDRIFEVWNIVRGEIVEHYAVTPDGIGAYWYDSLEEAQEQHGDDLPVFRMSQDQLDQIREAGESH